MVTSNGAKNYKPSYKPSFLFIAEYFQMKLIRTHELKITWEKKVERKMD